MYSESKTNEWAAIGSRGRFKKRNTTLKSAEPNLLAKDLANDNLHRDPTRRCAYKTFNHLIEEN